MTAKKTFKNNYLFNLRKFQIYLEAMDCGVFAVKASAI